MILSLLHNRYRRHAATLQALLLGSLVVLVMTEATGIYLLMKYYALVKLSPVTDINAPDIGYQASRLTQEQRALFLTELRQAGLHNFSGEMQVLKTMNWVMNQCSRVEVYFGANPYVALEHARNGGGLSCEPMARIFKEALTLLGLKARNVMLLTTPLSPYDTHMTVEVFIDSRWRIYDPTFNVSFVHRSNRQVLLNAQEIKNALQNGNFVGILPLSYGEVAYPARLEKYYIHYLPLYANVLVPEEHTISVVKKLPPLRYFYGPSLRYQAQPGGTDAKFFLMMHQEIYLLVMLVLPLIVLLVSAVVVMLILSNRGARS